MNLIRSSAVFHRDLKKNYPIITHGEGIYLFDENGKRYLDGSSGAVAANLGHSNEKIAKAMYEQARKVGFVHTLRFETKVLHKLANKIANLSPPTLNKVYFTSGGAEANESAIKLARQYHRDRGNKDKHLVIGRWQSYHGNTLGALSIGGDVKRRKPFSKNLIRTEHINPPNQLHCTICSNNSKKGCYCTNANELEDKIKKLGAENVSAFIMEPIVGSQQGALVPPKAYLRNIREICYKYDVVLIIDEVMTGFGRTGKNFAVEHFDIEPDIITFGKGVSAGYAPLAGMIVNDKIIKGIYDNSDGKFMHGYTYSGHPISVAAGLAALEIYETDNIVKHCHEVSNYLYEKLHYLKEESKVILDVRGRGLLLGIELVKNRFNKELFNPEEEAAKRFNNIAMERGLVLYPGSGGIDGELGEHLLVCPPLIISQNEIDELISTLKDTLEIFESESIP